ncbi:hypothetical protein G7B13_03095 [Klebsiella pneumoniae]|nr:hypothetical protein [Klebsiella pneumoniae]
MKKNLIHIIGGSGPTRPYYCLFLTSLILTVARGITLPFLVVFLHFQRGFGVDETGYIITAGIILGLFFLTSLWKNNGITELQKVYYPGTATIQRK